jgi:hypothetical protein
VVLLATPAAPRTDERTRLVDKLNPDLGRPLVLAGTALYLSHPISFPRTQYLDNM